MKTRTITLPSGQRMRVPQNIQRLDSRSTHGWQVRYSGSEYVGDAGDSPRVSLRRAIAALERRVRTLPAPDRLKRDQQSNKTSDMPLGISGPVVRRRGSFLEASLLVHLPRFGKIPKRGTVYLGTENTYTEARFKAGLQKAKALRAKAEEVYRQEATAARRAST